MEPLNCPLCGEPTEQHMIRIWTPPGRPVSTKGRITHWCDKCQWPAAIGPTQDLPEEKLREEPDVQEG